MIEDLGGVGTRLIDMRSLTKQSSIVCNQMKEDLGGARTRLEDKRSLV